MTKTFLLLFFLLESGLCLFGQTKRMISGTIIDKMSDAPLPYASISFKNSPSGTISNEKGDFSMIIPEDLQNDTLVINYVGYKQHLIGINSINFSLKIELEPTITSLDEVIISPFSAESYLKRAIRKIGENYAVNPFETLSYYKEEYKKNNDLMNRNEAVIKSYYPEYQLS